MRVRRLLNALQQDNSETALDIAALELASIEFPGLDVSSSLHRLDSMAEEIRSELPSGADGQAFIKITNQLLFETLQFRGNDQDYYDPRNSCLNSVLSRRIGIPITLSVIYIEMARRLKQPIYGVGLPGPLHRCL